MGAAAESFTEEIRQLRRCINDLVSVVALPATWAGGDSSRIVGNVLDALMSIMGLDFAYARLRGSLDTAPAEIVRVGLTAGPKFELEDLSEKVLQHLYALEEPSPVARIGFGEQEVTLVPLLLGLHGEMGVIVAGSHRSDFPQRAERLILDVAANQAAMGLQEAHLLKELDLRVTQRTAELVATNEELKREIAHRKRAEEALREGERESRLIVDTIPGLVAVLSATGDIEFVSRPLSDYYGKSLEELKSWAGDDTIFSGDRTAVIQAIANSVESGDPTDLEARFRRHDGTYRWFQVRGRPLRDRHGHIVRWYFLLTDTDEKRRAEGALNKARSDLAHVSRVTALSTLAASVAHEVNQPLSGIVTNASTCLRMLDGNPPNVEGARETARRTIRDGNRASEIITRLRALFTRKSTTFEWFDLNEATKEVLALSLAELQRNRVIVWSDFAPDLPPALGDRVQIQQVISNLVRNASDAMNTVEDRPRELGIRTGRHEAGSVRMSVQDTGIGLDPEAEAKLFEAFYTTKGDGMGIGLSVSRSIMESHQGRLWAVRNDGPGTTFLFSIPCGTNT